MPVFLHSSVAPLLRGGCLHGGISQDWVLATQTWFFEHPVSCLPVRLKPKGAAVCFPLVARAGPQRQIFNESTEKWNFPASLNLKQNQGSWHNALSEAVMERRELLPLCPLGVLQSTYPWRAAWAKTSCLAAPPWLLKQNQSLLLSMGRWERVPRVRRWAVKERKMDLYPQSMWRELRLEALDDSGPLCFTFTFKSRQGVIKKGIC